jgi:ADP-ribose pyrophosphatase YjhB (NUDIX family)
MTFIAYASTLITDEDNNILLVTEKKEINYNKLNLPGGHLELWESPMEWAIREALEETWVTIELNGLIGIYLGRNKPSFHYIFAGTIKSGTPQGNPTEVLSARWYSINEIISLPKEAFVYSEKLRDVIEKYQNKKLVAIEDVICDMKKI